MNSFDIYKLHIGFNQQVFGMKLQLVDGNLNTVYEGIAHELDLELPQGIYHLKISYIDYYQEKFFSVSGDTELILDFNYPLTVPVLGYSTTHEYYSEDAVKYSGASTVKGEQVAPNFFFFASLYDKDKFAAEVPQEWLKYYSIFNIDKTTEIQLNETNSVFDNEFGKIYFSVFLNPGLYFLNYNNKENPRIFPLYIFEDYQTQFFIRYTSLPDFKNCRFFFSQKKSFSESGQEYFILEKILYAYSNFKNFGLISHEELDIIKDHPYLVSLVNLLFTALNQKAAHVKQYKPEQSPVKDYPQLELPDIIYCRNELNAIYQLSGNPPLLSFVITKYTHQLDNAYLIFEPASVLDRIVDNINYDLFWNNFSKIDEPAKWANAYRPVLQTIDESQNAFIRTITHAKNAVINYLNPQFDDNLKHLVGRINLKEEQANVFNETIGKIKGVSEMSKEFGLPPTTILRNYNKYNKYFIQVKEPDPNKRVLPGQEERRATIILSLSGALALFIGAYFFWPTQNGLSHDDKIIADITTPVTTQTAELTTTTPDNNVPIIENNMTVKEKPNNIDIVKSTPVNETVKSPAEIPQSITQDEIAAVDRNAKIDISPPAPKSFDYNRVKSEENPGSGTGNGKSDNYKPGGNDGRNATMKKSERNRDAYEVQRANEEQTLNKNNPPKYSKEELKMIRTKDTLSKYNIIVNLLDLRKSLNTEFKKDTAYQYRYAKELFEVNTRMLEMLQANSSYLTTSLTKDEIVSMQNHFESWIYAYRKKESMSKGKKGIEMDAHFKLGDYIPFPDQVGKKIDEAYEDLKNRIND